MLVLHFVAVCPFFPLLLFLASLAIVGVIWVGEACPAYLPLPKAVVVTAYGPPALDVCLVLTSAALWHPGVFLGCK